MHFIFYKTSDVFKSEDLLQNNNIEVEVVPTPVQDKAYCGVCIKVSENEAEKIKTILGIMEYKMIK